MAGPLCAGGAFDTLCELSWSRGLGLCAVESAVGVAAAVSGGGWQGSAAVAAAGGSGARVESAAAADDVAAAAIAWVAEAGTASFLELALLEEAWRSGGPLSLSSSSSRAALEAPRWIFGPCAAVSCWDMAWHTDGRMHN